MARGWGTIPAPVPERIMLMSLTRAEGRAIAQEFGMMYVAPEPWEEVGLHVFEPVRMERSQWIAHTFALSDSALCCWQTKRAAWKAPEEPEGDDACGW
jgi:hypothetical protein